MEARKLGAHMGLAGILLAGFVLVLVFLPVRYVFAQPADGVELVMFVEPGCPWCRRWDQEVGEAYTRSAEGQRAPLRRVHIAEARRSGIKLTSAVTVTPTFVVVDQGVEVGRITGYPGADFFWGMLGELLAKRPPAPSSPQARDARSRGTGAKYVAPDYILSAVRGRDSFPLRDCAL